MDRTRPAHLIPGSFARDEADELEDVGQRNPGPDCGKVNARHGWSLRTESRGIIRAGAAWEAPMGTEKGWGRLGGSDGNREGTRSSLRVTGRVRIDVTISVR